MKIDELIKLLEEHLSKVEKTAPFVYVLRLQKTINKLIRSEYTDYMDLINDLQAVGFSDAAAKIRRDQIL